MFRNHRLVLVYRLALTVDVLNVKLTAPQLIPRAVRMTQPRYEELAENARLREVVEQQRQTILRQEQLIAGLQHQLQALREQLDEVRRRQKRQAAPFSK